MYQSYSDYNAGLARGLNLEAIGLDMAFRSDNRINHDNANEGEFYLNEFLIARIANLNPYNRYFKPLSWRIALTIDRFSDENRFRIEPLKYHLDLGLGLSFGSIEPRSTLIFWSADIDQTLEVGDLQYDFLPGTSLIIRKEFSKNFILFSKIKSYFSLLENKTLILTQDIELSWTPSPWLELELGYKQYLLDLSESSLTLNFKANF